jgi:mTERF domain-containing protein
MTMTAEALRYEIGTKDLGKVIAAYPSVLLLNAEEIILPTAAFLMDELGIEEGELASTLQLYPMLLNKDIGEMQRVVSYLASLGVKEEDLGSIFRSFPALLTTDIENDMVPVVEYLQSIGIQDIGSFITKLPPVLGYSVEKELQPKWEYLKRACFRPYFELEQFPAYFSYPFERVIKTRFDYLAAKKMARLLIPVAKVLVFGDVDFATQVARDKDGGKRFRAFVEGRRKGIRQPVQKRRKPKTNKPRRLKNKNDDSNA